MRPVRTIAAIGCQASGSPTSAARATIRASRVASATGVGASGGRSTCGTIAGMEGLVAAGAGAVGAAGWGLAAGASSLVVDAELRGAS